MAKAKAFLLRINPEVLDAVQRWANDDLRSLNGQIEFLLRKVLADAGRARPPEKPPSPQLQPPTQPDEAPPAVPGQPDEFFD